MNGTLTIAARELRERARVFAVCAVLAALPFLASLLPGASANRADVIAASGGFLSIAVGLGLAMSLGASTIGRELTEKRMSFYFTKPVSPAAIWFGKATAALAISLGCFALIAVPAWLATPDAWRLHWLGDAAPLAIGALMIVELFLVSHLMSSIFRSRSIVLAVDLVCLVATFAALWLIVRPLALGGSVDALRAILLGLGVAVSVILAVAPAWQLAQGRTDVRRGHAALSRFVWVALGSVLLIAGLYVAWVVSVDPQDLDEVFEIAQPSRGASVVVSGRNAARGEHTTSFLIDQRTSAHERLPVPQWWGSRYSDDGSVLLWQQPTGLFNVSRTELYMTRDGKTSSTGITLHPFPSAMLPNADGSRVAVIENRRAVVYETATGKLLAAGGNFDSRARHALFFASPDVVRIVEFGSSGTEGTLRVFELDVRARAIRQTGETKLATGKGESVSLSGDGTRMLVKGANVLVDARTAQVIAQLPVDARASRSGVLHDGSVVSISTGVPRLRMFSRDGQPLHDIALPGVTNAYLAGEIEGGKVLAVGVDRVRMDATGKGRKMFVVDVRRGVVERVVADVKGPMPGGDRAHLTRYAADQQLAAIDAQGELVTWDPRTGTVRKL